MSEQRESRLSIKDYISNAVGKYADKAFDSAFKTEKRAMYSIGISSSILASIVTRNIGGFLILLSPIMIDVGNSYVLPFVENKIAPLFKNSGKTP